MLAAAVHEVLPEGGGVRVVTLIPPGACPGHFDLPPSVVGDLRAARVVLCHDYQSSLKDRLAGLGAPASALLVAETPGSLLIPENYLSLVRRTADLLADRLPDRREAIRSGARSADERIKAFDESLRRDVQTRPWAGARIVASRHQEPFCRRLGLEVIRALGRPEDIAPKDWAADLTSPAALVVANLQEGTQAAEALGRNLKIPVVVFSNFPGAPGYGKTYEALIRANLARLDEAWATR
jgi:zinc transport system substrate-binding protein